jgi:integrase
VRVRGELVLAPPKTARSERTIALDDETVAALRNHRDAQRLERVLAGDVYMDTDLVFADELGAPIRPDRLTEMFGARREAAGIPVGTLHVLRHSAATMMLTAGVPLHVVANRLGDHPTTVLGTYSHLLPASDELAAQRMAAVLTPLRARDT